jgi:hypothetical protein
VWVPRAEAEAVIAARRSQALEETEAFDAKRELGSNKDITTDRQLWLMRGAALPLRG